MDVNITKRVDTPEGRRFCPAILGAGGRVKPDWLLVNDRQERHPEGAYYLDWIEDGKRVRIAVGADATAAYSCRNRKQSELEAIAQGLEVPIPSRMAAKGQIPSFKISNSIRFAPHDIAGWLRCQSSTNPIPPVLLPSRTYLR